MDNVMVQGRHVVTVFGSSRAQPNDDDYQAAHRLGMLIAQRGWTLCNGAHDGTMEAAARGAKETGGSTIGISLAPYRPVNRNRWLDQEIVAESLFVRLEKLVTLGEAYVVLRGGIGTLLELALALNLVQWPEFARKPLLVVGDDWRQVIETLRAVLPTYPSELDKLTLVPSVDEAAQQLSLYFQEGG